MNQPIRTLIGCCLAFILSTQSYSEPPNLSLLKQEIRSYHDSGRYEQELKNQIHQAQQYIINEANKHHSQKLALVLDIDETSLSNYDKIAKRDFSGTKEQIHQEILEANAPVIKPMLNLYHEAIKHGIKVFFVTGRVESERKATEKNLIKAGFTHWSGLYLRPKNYRKNTIVPFKSNTRALISQKGYLIIATIGDQFSDIRGGFAKKGFKLPNPFYYLP